MAASSASRELRPEPRASLTTFSTTAEYSGIVAALSRRLGFVVASRGWYLRIDAKSPVSATTTQCCLRLERRSLMVGLVRHSDSIRTRDTAVERPERGS